MQLKKLNIGELFSRTRTYLCSQDYGISYISEKYLHEYFSTK